MNLDLFFELSQDLFCIHRTDGYFEPLSSAWENVLGWTGTELRSRPWIEFVHPDDVKISLSVETQCTQEDTVEYENRYRHKDGRYYWLSWRVSRNEDGSVYAVGKNITAEKESQEQLRQSEEQLRLALDAAKMGFWAWNIQAGTVTWSDNFKRIFGLPLDLEEGSYELFLSIVHPDDRDRVHQASISSLESGQNGDISYRIVWPDGSVHWIESLFQFFFDEAGKPIRKTGIDLDVSERKRAELQLQESLQEKEVLLQEIHHRVKNNLQVICSLLDLQSQYIKEPAMRDMFRESYNRVKSMALVHEKLYQHRNFARINFAEYIESLTQDLFYAYRVKASHVTRELDIEEITLNIDTTIPCALIINELVSNALKYAFPDNQEGTISVALHTEESQQLTLTVKDSGKGLPKDFDFNTTKSLGLQLVKVLTNQLQGTLEIDSKSGTEFRISFSELI
ncbi:MAG TPA: hypothetical protein DCE56_06485 [Cyanobacteria bacterium UBA8553]|nr:hypothetical protein [Cyanobacteria bacterium UBA8553]